jgi:hypothetical protein
MGVDLHRIGFGISSGTSRNGFGTIVSFPSVVVSYPAAGTILETLTAQTYPISEGGASVSAGSASTPYPSQSASVYRKANGSGGDYLDWANVFDVAYYTYGVTIVSESLTSYTSISGTSYPNGSYDETWYHDGSGSYYSQTSNFSYTSIHTFIVSENNTIEVPPGSLNYFGNGTTTDYFHDGSGSWYSSSSGSYHSYGTFIINYAGTDYYWDGSGGYYS